MATTRQIRSRIRVAKNIQQITKAMKMVAAARLRRAQEAVEASRPYAKSMRNVMLSLSGSAGSSVRHPLLRAVGERPNGVGVLLVTSDRGMCGSYNSSVIRKALEIAREYDAEKMRFICVGKRGAGFMRKRGYNVVVNQGLPATGADFAMAQTIARAARDLFERGEIEVLYLIYTQFVTAMTQRPQVVQLLPIEPPEGNAAPTVTAAPEFRAVRGSHLAGNAGSLRGHAGLPGDGKVNGLGAWRANNVHVVRDR